MSQYDLNPELAEVVKHLPASTNFPHDPHVLREFVRAHLYPIINGYWKDRIPSESTYRVEDHKIAVHGGEITVRALTPTPAGVTNGRFPLLVWFFGAGWTVGSIEQDDYWLRTICVELQIVVLSVGYRLCPEYPYSVGHNDCYAAVKWAAENASALSADLSKGFILAGISSGSGTTAALAHRARDDPFFAENKIKITGQALVNTVACHEDAYPEKYKAELRSVEENKDAPLYNTDNLHLFYSFAKPNPHDPNFSPLLFPSHADLPPAYLQVCGLDVLRDEGLVYAKALTEAGVKTKLYFYPGCPHGFHVTLPQLKISQKLDEDFRNGLRWLLSETGSE